MQNIYIGKFPFLFQMKLTKNIRIILGVIIGVVVVGTSTGIIVSSLIDNNHLTITLLDNAGVMIEAEGMRIYIDPINLPDTYLDKPADVILITHEHSDHYQNTTISKLQKEDTVNIFPAVMTDAISLYDGIAVIPQDNISIKAANITAFYMYTIPVQGMSSHPKESNYTSYIIHLGGWTIFHAGDSYDIDEYHELTGEIDIVLLPLGPGCQTMANMDVVFVVQTIRPKYMIPIHYTEESFSQFSQSYVDNVEQSSCQYIGLTHFSSHEF